MPEDAEEELFAPLEYCKREPLPCSVADQEKLWRFARARGLLYEPIHTRAHELADFMALHRRDGSGSSESGTLAAIMEATAEENRVESESKSQVWEVEDNRLIEWTPRGISLRIVRGKHDLVVPVITGFLKPVRGVVVEGWTYFEVLISPSHKVVASAEDLLDRLERDGRIRKRKLGHDVLIEVLWKMAPDSAPAFPTYGIYALPTGELELCSHPVPVRDEQLEAQEQIAAGCEQPVAPADVQAYADLLEFYHPYEVLPAMALSAISPVAQVLRANDVFVPHLWNWSLAHGLGKSLVAFAFSRNLWGRAPATGSAINSEFRLAVQLDAASVPLAIDEGENVHLHRLSADLKASAERPIVSRRGTTRLLTVPYSSRCVLFFTGNRLVPKSGAALSRFLAPRFDSGQLAARKARKPELDAVFKRLRPVGRLLAEELVRAHPKLFSLLERVRELELQIARTGAAQGDIRRAQTWAVAYVGLETLASVFAAHGVAWSLPSVPEFVEHVAVPVDRHTYEGEETVVDAFRSWFEAWRARNVKKITQVDMGGRDGRERWTRDEEVAGMGQLFEDDQLKVGERSVAGTWVSKALTSEYNKQAAPDLRIDSLGEFAAHAADEAGIAHDQVLERDGKPKRVDFRLRKRVRAAFVPREPGGD